MVRTAKQARAWTRADFVILRVRSAKAVDSLPPGKYRSKLVVLAPAQPRPSLANAVDSVTRRGQPGFGVTLGARGWEPRLTTYLELLTSRSGRQLAPAAQSARDKKAPTRPTGLKQLAYSAISATLGWSRSRDNVGVAGYGLYLGGRRVASTTSLSYGFAGLACGTNYSAAVDAYDAAGNRSAKAGLTLSTTGCSVQPPSGQPGQPADTSAPSAPPGLVVASRGPTSLTLAWSAATDNVGVAGYHGNRNGTRVGSTTGLSFSFAGLTCATSYTFSVQAFDAAGNTSDAAAATLTAATSACSADGVAPSVPQSQSLHSQTRTSVAMSWSASTDNVGVTGYYVYLNDSRVGTTQALSWTFPNLTCGTTYLFGLEAYDAAGNVSNRDQAEGSSSTLACVTSGDTQAPTAPSGLASSGVSQLSISLSWNASSDNVAVVGYTVYLNGTSVGTTAASTRSFALGSLLCGTTYTLGVEAFDAAGNRSSRSTLSASTTACSVPPPSGSGANLWVSASGGSCVRSSVPVAFSAALACTSFAAAYAAAASGDVVGVVGTLGPQYFAGGYGASQAAGSKTITFRGDPGNVVQQVHSGSSNITYDGLNLDAGGVKTFGAVFEIGGGDNVTFRNGRIGNVVDEKAALINGNYFTAENVVFHDAVLRTDGVHMECVYAIVVPNFTVRNSTFTNCAVMDLFFTYGDWWSPRPPAYGNVTIEGNRFETPRDSNSSCCMYYGLYAGNTAYPAPGAIDGWRVRNNWFESSVAGFDSRTISNSVFCGNTGNPPSSWRNSC